MRQTVEQTASSVLRIFAVKGYLNTNAGGSCRFELGITVNPPLSAKCYWLQIKRKIRPRLYP